MARAPRGAVSTANEIHNLVKRIGLERAAEKSRVTPGYIQRIEHARATNTLGKIWTSKRAIESWGRRLAGKGRQAGPRRIFVGAAIRERPATTKAGQRAQEIARGLKVKDIAKALGISSQKASAERQKLLRGDIAKGDAGRTLKKWKEIDDQVSSRAPIAIISIEGYRVVVSPERPRNVDHTLNPARYTFSDLAEAAAWTGKNNMAAIAVVYWTPAGWAVAILESYDDFPDVGDDRVYNEGDDEIADYGSLFDVD